MVMKADVLARALDAVADTRPRLLMSPRGAPLTQARVEALAQGPGAVIVCGRYEGIDERLIEARGLEEISIGDYVLSGGEIAALALLDACVRLIPGVMGKEVSGAEESFSGGLLEYPQYTRPARVRGTPDPRRAGGRRPRQGQGLAAGAGRTPHPRAPARPLGELSRPPRPPIPRVTKPELCRRSCPTRTGCAHPQRGRSAQPTENCHEPHPAARNRARGEACPKARPFPTSSRATPCRSM